MTNPQNRVNTRKARPVQVVLRSGPATPDTGVPNASIWKAKPETVRRGQRERGFVSPRFLARFYLVDLGAESVAPLRDDFGARPW